MISLLATVVFVPLILLGSYILRTATLARRIGRLGRCSHLVWISAAIVAGDAVTEQLITWTRQYLSPSGQAVIVQAVRTARTEANGSILGGPYSSGVSSASSEE